MQFRHRLLTIVALVVLLPGALGIVTGASSAYAAPAARKYVLGTFTKYSFKHFLGATGWCSHENCDDQFQDGGNANCSLFQVIVTQQTVHDDSGRAFGTGWAFNSYDTTNGIPCYAAWEAISTPDSETVILFEHEICIGTLDSPQYCNWETTVGGHTIWFSTPMLSGDDLYQNTCISGWFVGHDVINGIGANFQFKLIGGGSHC